MIFLKLTIPKLKARLKDGSLCGAYLFYGEEKFILNNYTALIKSKTVTDFPEFNYMEFDEDSCDFEKFSSFVMSYPTLSETKMALVKNAGFLQNADNAKSIAEIVQNMPGYLALVFVEDEISKVKKSVTDAFEKCGCVTEFVRQKPADLRLWVAKKLAASGKKMLASDVTRLINMCACSLEKLNTECEKLIAAAPGEVIEKELIDTLVVVPAEYKVFEMSDNLLNRKGTEAYLLLKEFKINKEQPTEILTLIYAAVSEIYMFKTLSEQGGNPEAYLAPNRKWLAGKYRAQAAAHSKEKLRRIMRLCYKCDRQIKTGAAEPYTSLELVMAEMMS